MTERARHRHRDRERQRHRKADRQKARQRETCTERRETDPERQTHVSKSRGDRET